MYFSNSFTCGKALLIVLKERHPSFVYVWNLNIYLHSKTYFTTLFYVGSTIPFIPWNHFMPSNALIIALLDFPASIKDDKYIAKCIQCAGLQENPFSSQTFLNIFTCCEYLDTILSAFDANTCVTIRSITVSRSPISTPATLTSLSKDCFKPTH